MVELPGYQIIEEIFDDHGLCVVRAVQENDASPVMLKLLKEGHAAPERSARLRHEFDILEALDLAGVVRAQAWKPILDTVMIVMEDFSGISLEKWLKIPQGGSLHLFGSPTLDWQDVFLRLALRVCEALDQLHQQQVLHLNINPSNILMDPKTGQIKLTDFSCASRLAFENVRFQSPASLQGMTGYLAPERTGRTSHFADYRADYYSLGAVFYALLCGKPPFASSDPMELAYAVMSRAPAPPHTIKPVVYPAISEIVVKLLEKNPDDRYQSMRSLVGDLEVCLNQLVASNHITPFGIAQQDISSQFRMPQKLYGRDEELAVLYEAIGRISQSGTESTSRCELALITGEMGIGKTRLVQETLPALTYRGGYFTSGKYDQHQRSGPYGGLFQALRVLVRQLLTEGKGQIENWSERIQAALESNGKLIVDVIPELEQIIGVQPDVPDLTTEASENRFRIVLEKFVRVFARIGHPLVLFLDDLQWADRVSLRLIEALVSHSENASLLVIGAYREGEAADMQPLVSVVERIREGGGVVSALQLTSLNLSDVTTLICDLLFCSAEDAEPLAELVMDKSGGNPFLIVSFLKNLYDTKLLVFGKAWGTWQWSIKKVSAQFAGMNVGGLLDERIEGLPYETLEVVKVAACLGECFDLCTLAYVLEKTPQEIAQQLWDAVVKGVLLPVGDGYKLVLAGLELQHIQDLPEYRFAHAAVHDAVYRTMLPPDRQKMHLRIGQQMLLYFPESDREQRIYEAVFHLNQGRGFMSEQSEKEALVKLNSTVSSRARSMAAYEMAWGSMQTSLELLPGDSWETDYEFSMQLYRESAETACLSGSFEEAQRLTAALAEQVRNPLDRLKIQRVRLGICGKQNQPEDALLAGLEGLAELGIAFPESPERPDVQQAFHSVEDLIGERQPEDLVSLPLMQEEGMLVVMEMLQALSIPAERVRPHLHSLILLKRFSLMLEHGRSPDAVEIFAGFGVILCGVMARYEDCYQYGRLALDLAADDKSYRNVAAILSVNTHVRHWKEPLRYTLPALLEGYRRGVNAGDMENAARCLIEYSTNSFYLGGGLLDFEREMMVRSKILRYQLQVEPQLSTHVLFHQAAANLIGEAHNPASLSGEWFDEGEAQKRLVEDSDEYGLFQMMSLRAMLAYHFGEKEQALTDTAAASKYLHAAGSRYSYVLHHFYDALIRMSCISQAIDNQQEKILERVAAHQEKLALWAHHAPENYLGKLRLVEAERARFDDRRWEAIGLYDEAIDLANQHGYLAEEALACELAGSFYLELGRSRMAQFFLDEARRIYRRWGARAKVQYLEKCYSETLTPATGALKIGTGRLRELEDAEQIEALLMVDNVVDALQSISSEIELASMCEQAIHVLVEGSGAQSGYLILERDGRLVVEAQLHTVGGIYVAGATPLEEAEDDLPVEAISHAYTNRTMLLLRPAATYGVFMQDPYFQRFQPASALCLPILRGEQLKGVLYLEESRNPEAFSQEQIAFLETMGTQVAISFDHARQHAELMSKNEDNMAQLRMALMEVENLSTIDTLTGTYNRRKFDEIALREITHIQRMEYPLSLVILDIDQFSRINARFGRDAGDKVLKTIGMKLRQNLRNLDALARWRGGSFAIMAPETKRTGALELSEKLRRLIGRQHFVGVGSLTVSLGVAVYKPGETLAEFVERAENALSEAKRFGRDKVQVAF